MTKEKNNRSYPDRPIAAVGVVVLKENNVLLIQRNKPPKEKEWSIPGGAQNLGETTKEAAIREVKEETGLKIKNLELLDVIDYIQYDDNGKIEYHYNLTDFFAEYESGELMAADDAFEAKWVNLNEIHKINLWKETSIIIQKAINFRTDQLND